MKKNCYIVEVNSALVGLFEQLDDYGFDYECDESCLIPGYIEICVSYYSHEVTIVKNIFAPYV